MRQLFKGGNYSREETINYWDFLSATTIQGRQLFKGGNYSQKYGSCGDNYLRKYGIHTVRAQ